MTIQIIATIIILTVLIQLILKIIKDKASIAKIVFWGIFWSLALVVIWVPKEILDNFGNIFGVGRGIDVLVYLSIIMLFYLNLTMNSKIEKLEKEITKLVREIAKKKD